jgi:phosphomannomutase
MTDDENTLDHGVVGTSVRSMDSVESRRRLGGSFREQGGFGRILSIRLLDGKRNVFSNNDVAHLRPSGNAPEFRMYATAETPERSHEIVESCKRIVPQMILQTLSTRSHPPDSALAGLDQVRG